MRFENQLCMRYENQLCMRFYVFVADLLWGAFCIKWSFLSGSVYSGLSICIIGRKKLVHCKGTPEQVRIFWPFARARYHAV
jgi:hypothetical protein